MRKGVVFSFVMALLGLSPGRGQVANGSFEQWQEDTVGYAPAGYDRWFTWGMYFSMVGLPSNVGPTGTGAIAGNYSLKLTTVQLGSDTIPGIMTMKVGGYNLAAGTYPVSWRLKYSPQNGDSAQLGILALNGGDTIVGGMQVMSIPSTTADTMISASLTIAPFLGNATSLVVVMVSGENPGSTLWVDSIIVNGSSLPNPGFEQWTPLVDASPVSWDGLPAMPQTETDSMWVIGQTAPQVMNWFMGDSLAGTLRKTADAYGGSYAARLMPRTIMDIDSTAILLYGSIPFPPEIDPLPMQDVSFSTPLQSLTFYYRTVPDSQAIFVFAMRVKDANTDTTYTVFLPPAPNYTQYTHTLPVSITPDSLGLLFAMEGDPVQGWMHVDEVYVNTATGLKYALMNDDVAVWYDGASLRLNAWPLRAKHLTLRVVNVAGQEVGVWDLTPSRRQVAWKMPVGGGFVYVLTDEAGKVVKSAPIPVAR